MTDAWRVEHDDCMTLLDPVERGSVDAVVTDPPYGIDFQHAAWDGRTIATTAAQLERRRLTPSEAFEVFSREWAQRCLPVLKPGGHLVAFGAPRTAHRLACALEDAGFELRDTLMWLFGEGLPKSRRLPDGRGTSLKPAYEPILLACKPPADTVARNLREHGTGALEIDACRVRDHCGGRRWPANVVASHARGCDQTACVAGCAAAALDECAGRPVSRFFYCPKARHRERDAGCEQLPARTRPVPQRGQDRLARAAAAQPAPPDARGGRDMPAKTSGQVLERSWKSGRGFALRVRAYGKRHYVTLGLEADGWSAERAEEELQNILADVRRAIWDPTRPQPPPRPRRQRTRRRARPRPDVPRVRLAMARRPPRRDQPRHLPGLRRRPDPPPAALLRPLAPERDRHPRRRRLPPPQGRAGRAASPRDRGRHRRARPRRQAHPAALAGQHQQDDRRAADGARPSRRVRLHHQQPRSRPATPSQEARAAPDPPRLLPADPGAARRRHRAGPQPGTTHHRPARNRRHAHARRSARRGALPPVLARRRPSPTAASTSAAPRPKPACARSRSSRSCATNSPPTRPAAPTPAPTTPVFPTATGSLRDKDNLRVRVLAPVLRRADTLLADRGHPPLPAGVTPHKLRHTFASILVACGEDPASVMAQLGHTDAKFTLRVYTHLMRRDPAERARLRALVEGGGCSARRRGMGA